MTPLEHPVCSHELNPIQNFWGWIKMGISSTVHAPHEAIFNNWSNIPTSLQGVLGGLKYLIS